LQHAQACFLDDRFTPAGYTEPAIPDAVTKAQDTILQQWKQNNEAQRRLHDVDVPTLVLAGTNDQVLWPRNSVLLSRMLPDATLVEVTGGGHAMMYQYPRELARRIDAFIAKG
jgi:pimeloyl-ACP methyl ester carboxylesterase